MVSISACHADDPGSIPGRGVLFTGVRATDGFFGGHTAVAVAVIAQLGERQTEDLEVPGSIPGLGIYLFLSQQDWLVLLRSRKNFSIPVPLSSGCLV